ncbi:MAG: hypothetical protein SWK90_00095 [Chloroflexota bacterium]|nr:hypothetical protein [Chloroflexota bacterium]
MTTRAKVAVLYTQPSTILKDNISWHSAMPSANTTPWQLEGTTLALRQGELTLNLNAWHTPEK